MVKTKGKLKYLFAVGFFIAGIIGGAFWFIYNNNSYDVKVVNEISNNLIKIIEEKTQKINNYLEVIEKNVKVLQESDEVKELLKKDLVLDESVIKMDVDERARIISKEVENYLRVHPKMTLKNLQESREFQKITIQPVGKEGYSFLFDSQSLINYFHKEPRRIGYDYNTMEETFPALWNMFKESSEKGFSEGFYYRDEPDGSTSYKYGKFVQISVKTADGISMSLGTTAYVDDYKTIKEESEYLENFKEDLDYHNLILVSPEGYIIYMAKPMEDFGTSLEWELNLKEGLSQNYFDVKEKEKISFSEISIRHHEDVYPKNSVMASVYEGNNLLGYIGLIDEVDKLFEITEDIESLGETGETYLINDEKLLISPSRNSDFDIMIQSIDTENAQNCFNEAFPGHIHKEEPVAPFLDYRGEEVLGTHREISETDWCLLAEIDKEEASNASLKEYVKKNIFFSLIGIFVFSLIGFFIGIFWDKKYREAKIRKFPCGVRGKFQPWYCKLIGGNCATYPNERCGTVIKVRKFLINLKLSHLILISLVFAVGYFFLINLFFDRIIYPLIVSGLLSFIVGFLMFFHGFKLKYSRSRKYLFLGGGAIMLYHLIHIPMEQYFNTVRPFNIIYWAPELILYAFGFLFLLIFIRKNVK